GPAPITEDHFGHGQAVRHGRDGQAPAIAEPFRDEAVILRLALQRAVLPEVVVGAVDPDNGLAARPVVAIGGCPLSALVHDAAPSSVITEKDSIPGCTIHREWVRLTCVRLRSSDQSGRPDSNRRRPAWEAGILPLNYARIILIVTSFPSIASAPFSLIGRIHPGRTAALAGARGIA